MGLWAWAGGVGGEHKLVEVPVEGIWQQLEELVELVHLLVVGGQSPRERVDGWEGMEPP